MPNILIVDDERPIVEAIAYNLKKEGYSTFTAGDAGECVAAARHQPPDLVVLDVMLPSGSGLDICRQLRYEHGPVPILFLTARAAEADRLKGFEVGGDDYVVKPFSMRELMARIRALLRRNVPTEDRTPKSVIEARVLPREEINMKIGNISVDRSRREVLRDGNKLELTKKEFDLLATLMSTPGRVFDRQTLLNRVWGEDCYVDERTVDVHIRWLREKIESIPAVPTKLITVRGVGYKFA
jgi:DNA-binding response OmpR family regulator